MADLSLSSEGNLRREQMNRASDYLRQELPGFDSQLSVERDPSMFRLRVRGAVTFQGGADVATYPLMQDHRGEVLKSALDEMIWKTRDEGIQALGLDARIQERVDEQVAATIRRKQVEWERKGFEKGVEFGVRTTMKVKREIESEEGLDSTS